MIEVVEMIVDGSGDPESIGAVIVLISVAHRVLGSVLHRLAVVHFVLVVVVSHEVLVWHVWNDVTVVGDTVRVGQLGVVGVGVVLVSGAGLSVSDELHTGSVDHLGSNDVGGSEGSEGSSERVTGHLNANKVSPCS